MLHRTTRYILAAIQAIIGWEWLMSGGNKLFSGTFPQGLADTLNNHMKDNPNGWYVTFLQQNVLPHSILYGYLIEWTEVAIGVIFLAGALILLGQQRVQGEPQHRLAVAYSIVVALVALTGIIMTVNFHFLMGGWIIPLFNSSAAYGESIDLDALLPPLSLVIIIANLALANELTRGRLFSRFTPKAYKHRSVSANSVSAN
ncbi:MAG: hypothetical protein ACJ788_12010 [Ktedonobacteraceae bacterium]